MMRMSWLKCGVRQVITNDFKNQRHNCLFIVFSVSISYFLCLAKSKGADQTTRMCMLVCAFVVRILQSEVFKRRGTYPNHEC